MFSKLQFISPAGSEDSWAKRKEIAASYVDWLVGLDVDWLVTLNFNRSITLLGVRSKLGAWLARM